MTRKSASRPRSFSKGTSESRIYANHASYPGVLHEHPEQGPFAEARVAPGKQQDQDLLFLAQGGLGFSASEVEKGSGCDLRRIAGVSAPGSLQPPGGQEALMVLRCTEARVPVGGPAQTSGEGSRRPLFQHYPCSYPVTDGPQNQVRVES